MQISREDYDKVSEEINKRFQEEIIFDQLVTTVIEWHEAMVKFAARSDAASVSSYPTMLKKIRECNLMLRIANILSTALSFTENIEDDCRHNKNECGKPICTIARELRNRIQHSSIRPQHGGGWTNMRLATPQMNEMPANFTKNSVTLSIPWRKVWAAPLRADGLAAILATAARPRTDGRGVESHTTAHRRGRLDAVRLAVVHGRAAAVGSERA